MQKNGRRGRWSCGEGVWSNLKGLTLKRINARSNVNDSAKAVILCEYIIHIMWISVLLLVIPHLCNMKQNGYQNAAFGCFVLMPFYDIVSFTAVTTITGMPSSLSATLYSFWLTIFSLHPLQTRKKRGIIWPNKPKWSYLRGRGLGFYRLRDWAAPQGVAERNETLCCHVGDEENLSGSTDKGCRYRTRFINSTNPRKCFSLRF